MRRQRKASAVKLQQESLTEVQRHVNSNVPSVIPTRSQRDIHICFHKRSRNGESRPSIANQLRWRSRSHGLTKEGARAVRTLGDGLFSPITLRRLTSRSCLRPPGLATYCNCFARQPDCVLCPIRFSLGFRSCWPAARTMGAGVNTVPKMGTPGEAQFWMGLC